MTATHESRGNGGAGGAVRLVALGLSWTALLVVAGRLVVALEIGPGATVASTIARAFVLFAHLGIGEVAAIGTRCRGLLHLHVPEPAAFAERWIGARARVEDILRLHRTFHPATVPVPVSVPETLS